MRVNKTDFHMKGFALGLALVTRKPPIVSIVAKGPVSNA